MRSRFGCRDCGREFPGAHVLEICADCVCKRLAEHAAEIVQELLPNGHFEKGGREYRVGSLAGEPGRSLAIAIGGPRSGRWQDHGAGVHGDLYGLYAGCKNVDRIAALRWAREWLGHGERRPAVRSRGVPAPREAVDADTRDRAEGIWHEVVPLHPGDPVDRYLAGRAIELERLAEINGGKLPAALRFHAQLWHRETRRCYPAMVAAIQGPEDEFLAVHRTWLVVGKDGCVTKAPVETPKMTLGTYTLAAGAGCIRLWRPDWRAASDQDVLALGEGIEDALTFIQAVIKEPKFLAKIFAEEEPPLLRVAAGVSLSAMEKTWVPPVISRIVLLKQNDPPGRPATLVFEKVRQRFRREGRAVWLQEVPREVKDINELAVMLARR
jgi:hypothetical protein